MQRRWTLRDPEPEAEAVRTLSSELDISSLTARLLVNRGIRDPDEALRFLHPRFEDLHDPYLMKDMDPDDLVLALRKVIQGEMVVAPELAGKLAMIIKNRDEDLEEEDKSIFSSLSPREMEILSHLTEGQSNKVIARHLGISDGTVKLHVKSILKKLGLHSRVEAAVLAANERLFANKR